MDDSLNPPTFLGLTADWARKAFPNLLIREGLDNLPVQIYKLNNQIGLDGHKWLVSIQHYQGGRICIWNYRLSTDYIEWHDLADPDLFTKLERFIDHTVEVSNDPLS